MKFVMVVAGVLIPVSAFAGGTGHSPVPVVPSAVVAPSVSEPVSSSSTSGANARSSSRSSSRVTVNNASGGGSSGGSGRAPDVIGVPLVGANNCSVGLTLGGSGPNAGGLLGLLWESGDCSRNRDATLLVNMGRPGAGMELLCESMAIRNAMARNGTPCQIDLQRWTAAGWKPAAGRNP